MKKLSLKQIEIIGAVWVSLAGSLDHFLYDWTKWTWLAVVSPVNESPWEHLKLLVIPVLMFLAVEWFWVENKSRLLFAKTVQIVFGMAFIIGFFYAYTTLFHFENVWIDIASFIMAVILGYMLSYRILKSAYEPHLPAWFWGIALALIFAFFQLMSWKPFFVPLFQDKPTGTYGIHQQL